MPVLTALGVIYNYLPFVDFLYLNLLQSSTVTQLGRSTNRSLIRSKLENHEAFFKLKIISKRVTLQEKAVGFLRYLANWDRLNRPKSK